MFRRFRLVRITSFRILAWFAGILFLLVVLLWLRSYWYADSLNIARGSGFEMNDIRLLSNGGLLNANTLSWFIASSSADFDFRRFRRAVSWYHIRRLVGPCSQLRTLNANGTALNTLT